MVTGGAVRIGRVITEALQAAGAEVVVQYRNSKEEAEALSPFTIRADLQSMEECTRLIEEAGKLDILINNASIFSKDSLADSTPDRVQREFNVNLFAPMELTRAFAAQPTSPAACARARRLFAAQATPSRRVRPAAFSWSPRTAAWPRRAHRWKRTSATALPRSSWEKAMPSLHSARVTP